MKTGRSDLDAMIRVSSIPSDEPTFLLRAQDSCAAEAVRAWAELQLAIGTSTAVVEQALTQADAMDAWPVKKTPDAAHLSEGHAKRLAYEFVRREWNGGDLTPSALAHARGEAAMLSALQPLVDFLGVLSTLRDPSGDQEALGMRLTSIRAVAISLLKRAAEHGVLAAQDGFEPAQAGSQS